MSIYGYRFTRNVNTHMYIYMYMIIYTYIHRYINIFIYVYAHITPSPKQYPPLEPVSKHEYALKKLSPIFISQYAMSPD